MLCMDLAVIMLKLDILSSPSMSADGIESGVWSLSLKDFSSLSMLPMDVDFRSFWHDDDEWFKEWMLPNSALRKTLSSSSLGSGVDSRLREYSMVSKESLMD